MNIENAIGLAKNINTFIFAVNILFAVFAIALGFILTRSITKPVEKLRTERRIYEWDIPADNTAAT